MRFLNFKQGPQQGLAIADGNTFKGLFNTEPSFPGSLLTLLQQGPDALKRAGDTLRRGQLVDLTAITFLPPIENPGRIWCIGLNYVDHSLESGFAVPTYAPVLVPGTSGSAAS